MRGRNTTLVMLLLVASWSLGAAGVALGRTAPDTGVEPEWIWSTAEPSDDERVWVRFTFDGPIEGGKLIVTCDNQFVAFVDDQFLARGRSWEALHEAPLPALGPGRHAVWFWCRNESGPAGLLARVELERASGATRHGSSPKWRWTAATDSRQRPTDDATWHATHSFGAASKTTGPWANPLRERQATPVDDMKIVDGFRVELLRSAQVGEGSWASMTFDHRGRIIVSPQRGELLRFTVRGSEVETERLTGLPVRDAQGLLYAHDGLYVNQTSSAKAGGGLYHLRDTDGDDQYDSSRRLSSYSSGGEHGCHGIVLGPDDHLYMVNGNMTTHPPIAPESPHRNYAEDVLLERTEDPRGHAHGVRAPAGTIWRIDPRRNTWQLFAGGFRNPYDLAFSPEGELFTFDADMEWDIGLPWYRPTRVCHVVPGAEYGWRSGSSKWPATSFDALPAVCDIGEGSPTGIVFGTRSHFPPPFRRALLISDWTFGRIIAVHLEADGASYRGRQETFLSGKPLNITDLDFGPDGALYFTTGGRGTQSGLYRVTAKQPVTTTLNPRPITPAVVARRQLAGLAHANVEDDALKMVWRQAGSADPFVRHASRLVLESLGSAKMIRATQAIVGSGRLAQVSAAAERTGLLARARVGQDRDRAAVLERVLQLPFATVDADIRDELLRLVEVVAARSKSPLPAERREQFDRWFALFPTGDGRVDRRLLDLEIAWPGGGPVTAVIPHLEDAELNRTDRFAFGFSLRLAGERMTDADLERYLGWIARTSRETAGGLSYRGYLDRARERVLAHLDESARTKLIAAVNAKFPPPPRREIPPRRTEDGWKVAAIEPYFDQVGRGRDFAAGKKLFDDVLCSACHRFALEGGDIAPDLTAASSRFSRRDLLIATIDPAQDISDQYAWSIITTKSGEEVEGRIVARSARGVTLTVDAFGEERQFVANGDIASERISQTSPMPEGLLDDLTLQQVLDLMAYIEAGGDAKHPNFAK